MSKKEKCLLRRIIAAGIIFVLALPLHYCDAVFAATGVEFFQCVALKYIGLPIFLAAYAIIGWDIIRKAFRNIRNGQIFDENLLMTIATIGAFCLAEYAEGVAVMLFYQVGELFQSTAVSRSRRSIAGLMDIHPDYANVMRDGVPVQVDPDDVAVGDIILIRPGERIPLDGIVEEGSSSVDTSALTGESAPRDVAVGEEVISGCVNRTGVLRVRVSREFGQSTVSKILELVENASDKKSRSENFITRFARYYTPSVVVAALSLSVIPPLVTGQAFTMWISRALTFLVISCPCALVISVPLSFFGGIGGASKSGVLVKGSNYLELLAKTRTVVFDKTGTLTKGSFAVSEVRPIGMAEGELLSLAAIAEAYSSHPVAESIRRSCMRQDYPESVEVEEIAGRGVRAVVDGREVLVGNESLMKFYNIQIKGVDFAGTIVHLAVDGVYAGCILVEDEIKPDSIRALRELKAFGVKRTVMLTGDNAQVAEKVAAVLGIDEVYSGLLPVDKVERLENLMEEQSGEGVLAFVGDGINDAPVLARSDVGIAMGALGSDAAIEAADVVIMTDEPSKIVTAINISRKTLRIVRQNIVFALFVKGIVLALGALGFANMWGAVFADVGVSVIAILNAMRALRVAEFGN